MKYSQFLILKDRSEVYKDFTINLLNYIMYYYFDKDTLNNDKDINNHYNFCYNKVCDEFLKENIDFRNNEKLNNYLYNYFYNNVYHSSEMDTHTMKSQIEKFWNNIFNVKKITDNNTLNVLVEVYMIFDETIDEIKKKYYINS